jgi:hypothetical protein
MSFLPPSSEDQFGATSVYPISVNPAHHVSSQPPLSSLTVFIRLAGFKDNPVSGACARQQEVGIGHLQHTVIQNTQRDSGLTRRIACRP